MMRVNLTLKQLQTLDPNEDGSSNLALSWYYNTHNNKYL